MKPVRTRYETLWNPRGTILKVVAFRVIRNDVTVGWKVMIAIKGKEDFEKYYDFDCLTTGKAIVLAKHKYLKETE